jgi:hypothetical protein
VPNGRLATGFVEALVVWTLYGLTAVAIFITYWRVPPEELFNVSGEGLDGGAGRTLVFLGYSTSIAAVALIGFAYDRLGGRLAAAASLVAIGLCITIAWPGVIEQSDLDAKPVNALAGIGVAVAVGLTAAAVRLTGLGTAQPWHRGDWARTLLAVVLLVSSIPWIGAVLGFHVGGPIFLTDELRPEPGHPELRAVHLGQHHGSDGVLLVLSGLVLSRALGTVRRRRLRAVLTGYIALMIAYGFTIAAQDFWLEQVVKRDWLEWEIPDAVRPSLEWIWLVILGLAATLYPLLRPRVRRA